MGRHSKSYTLEATEKFNDLGTQRLGMSYKVGINRVGKKKGYCVISNIIRMAFNEIRKSIKNYLKEHPYSRDFTISFVIRNAQSGPYDFFNACSNDSFEIFNYNCRDLDHHIDLNIKYVLANCTGNFIVSQCNSESIDINIENSKFEAIRIHNTACQLEIAGTEIKNGVCIDNSTTILHVLPRSSVDRINIDYCREANIFITDEISAPNISSQNSNLYIFGLFGCPVSINELNLSFANVHIKHIIKANTLRLHKSFIGYFDTLANYGTESKLECNVIDNITDVTNIEGDIIAYKVLIDKPIKSENDIAEYQGDNRFRIAKVRIPADVPRVIPCNLDPVIRVAKVEVLDMYIVGNDGSIIESTNEPAYNFVYTEDTIEYYKGAAHKANDFDTTPYHAYGPGIYCYTTLEYALRYVKCLYEEYNR